MNEHQLRQSMLNRHAKSRETSFKGTLASYLGIEEAADKYEYDIDTGRVTAYFGELTVASPEVLDVNVKFAVRYRDRTEYIGTATGMRKFLREAVTHVE